MPEGQSKRRWPQQMSLHATICAKMVLRYCSTTWLTVEWSRRKSYPAGFGLAKHYMNRSSTVLHYTENTAATNISCLHHKEGLPCRNPTFSHAMVMWRWTSCLAVCHGHLTINFVDFFGIMVLCMPWVVIVNEAKMRCSFMSTLVYTLPTQ